MCYKYGSQNRGWKVEKWFEFLRFPKEGFWGWVCKYIFQSFQWTKMTLENNFEGLLRA